MEEKILCRERDENRGSGKRERKKKFGIGNWRKGIERSKERRDGRR